MSSACNFLLFSINLLSFALIDFSSYCKFVFISLSIFSSSLLSISTSLFFIEFNSYSKVLLFFKRSLSLLISFEFSSLNLLLLSINFSLSSINIFTLSSFDIWFSLKLIFSASSLLTCSWYLSFISIIIFLFFVSKLTSFWSFWLFWYSNSLFFWIILNSCFSFLTSYASEFFVFVNIKILFSIFLLESIKFFSLTINLSNWDWILR